IRLASFDLVKGGGIHDYSRLERLENSSHPRMVADFDVFAGQCDERRALAANRATEIRTELTVGAEDDDWPGQARLPSGAAMFRWGVATCPLCRSRPSAINRSIWRML